MAVPVFTWTGAYIGVNAGGAFREQQRQHLFRHLRHRLWRLLRRQRPVRADEAGLAPVVPLTGLNTFGLGFNNQRDDTVFAGGGQIGYNYQFTPGAGWVIGIEADIQGVANNNRNDDFLALSGLGAFGAGIFTAATVAPIAPGSGIATPTGIGNGALGNVALFNRANGLATASTRSDWFATVRGKLGYAWDRFLIYGTGGVAFRDNNNNCDMTSTRLYRLRHPERRGAGRHGLLFGLRATPSPAVLSVQATPFLLPGQKQQQRRLGGGRRSRVRLHQQPDCHGRGSVRLLRAQPGQQRRLPPQRQRGRRLQHRRADCGQPAWLRQPPQSGRLRRGSGGLDWKFGSLLA